MELFIIIALVSLMVGLVLGIFLGARLTRSHYLYMAMMQQPRPSALPAQRPQPPRTRKLRRDEDYY